MADIVFPLPASDLLFVGKRTFEALKRLGIWTIGDIAHADRALLTRVIGSSGDLLWRYANGLDDEPVTPFYVKRDAKSVGNGMTFKRDIMGKDEIRIGISELADDVSTRLRAIGKKGYVIAIQIKTPNFKVVQKQRKMNKPTWLQSVISEECMALFETVFSYSSPVRSLTITVSELIDAGREEEQMSIFAGPDENDNEKKETIESAIDDIRHKFGHGSIHLGLHEKKEIGVDHSKKSE